MNAVSSSAVKVLTAIILFLTFLQPCLAANARNIILMIGDGMGPSQVHALWIYSAEYLDKNLAMVEVMNKGRTAFMYNDTVDNIVPDSAAAATQIATGVRVTNRVVSVDGEGKPLKSILELARDKGKATGLVTTSAITDATPAAFAAHVKNRRDEDVIAEQLIESGVHVMFGGGRAFFIPGYVEGSKRKDDVDLLGKANKSGYEITETAEGMMKSGAKKLLGLFSLHSMPSEVNRQGSHTPSLAEMTKKAIEILSASKDGFFLMVEGGGIDHASHHNDITALISEVMAFDDAVKVAYEFQMSHGDTLLIITADHETGGLALLPRSVKDRKRKENDSAEGRKEIDRHARWATGSHTATPLFLWGIGPGSEKINGWRHNTEVYFIMREAYRF